MNTPPTFQTGDTVMLLAGSPLMVIEDKGVDPDTFVCVWTDSRERVHRKIFAAQILKKITPPDKPNGGIVHTPNTNY